MKIMMDDLSKEKNSEDKPSYHLHQNFYSMLNEEKNKLKTAKKLSLYTKIAFRTSKYAAIVIVTLSIGFMVGRKSTIDENKNYEIAELRTEISQMQNNFTRVALEVPTAGQRLKAIKVVNSFTPDTEVIKALIRTLNVDENTNVRMAAANALSNYTADKEISDALAESLTKQSDPIIQITLINILVQAQSKKTKSSLEKIIYDKNTIPVVKKQAQTLLKTYI